MQHKVHVQIRNLKNSLFPSVLISNFFKFLKLRLKSNNRRRAAWKWRLAKRPVGSRNGNNGNDRGNLIAVTDAVLVLDVRANDETASDREQSVVGNFERMPVDDRQIVVGVVVRVAQDVDVRRAPKGILQANSAFPYVQYNMLQRPHNMVKVRI